MLECILEPMNGRDLGLVTDAKATEMHVGNRKDQSSEVQHSGA